MVEFGRPVEPFRPTIKKSSDVRNSIIGCTVVLVVLGVIAGFVVFYFVRSAVGGVGDVIHAMEMNLPTDSSGLRIQGHLDSLKELADGGNLSENDVKLLNEACDAFNTDGILTPTEVRQMDGLVCLVLNAHGVQTESSRSGYIIPQPRTVTPPNAPRYIPPPKAPKYTPPPPKRVSSPPRTSPPVRRTTTPRRTYRPS